MKRQLEAITPEERLRIVTHGLFETIPTAAKRLHVSNSTVYRWIEMGEVAELNTGKVRFVLTESINAKFGADIRLPDTGNIPSHLRGADRKAELRKVLRDHQRDVQQAQAAG
jgi:excisionase family DNA binding protein